MGMLIFFVRRAILVLRMVNKPETTSTPMKKLVFILWHLPSLTVSVAVLMGIFASPSLQDYYPYLWFVIGLMSVPGTTFQTALLQVDAKDYKRTKVSRGSKTQPGERQTVDSTDPPSTHNQGTLVSSEPTASPSLSNEPSAVPNDPPLGTREVTV